MSLVQIVVLALVQGLTEFLPVSSSAHLVLVSWLAGWPDQGLALDVAVHLGTLLAVLFYFRTTLAGFALAWLRPDDGGRLAGERRLSLQLLLASLPVLVIGFLAYDFVSEQLRDVRILAWTTIIFGLVLWLADRHGRSDRTLADLRLPGALAIGLAQVVALVPGASRSGVTMTMGRFLGLDADAAARFSFLLSIPVISAAGAHGLWQMARGEAGVAWTDFALAVLLAALAGWACISLFLAVLQRLGLLPFVLYRLAFGVVLLLVLY